MDDLILAVNDAMKRINKFEANTRKSVTRLKTVEDIRARLNLLQKNWTQFHDAWTVWRKATLKSHDEDDTGAFDDEQYENAEFDYVNAEGSLNTILATLLAAADPQVPPVANAIANVDGGMRMRAIDPPTFSGKIEDWVSFRDLFVSVVRNNNSLYDVHRMQYLRTSCQGQAAEVIRHLEVNAANFQIAWEALTRRFENERLLVSRIIKRLLELPQMTRECPIELARLLDGTTQALSALKNLKRPTQHWDDILVVHTVLKLDMATRLRWERSIAATTAMPTFKEIDDHLSGVLRSFEAVCDEREMSYDDTRTTRKPTCATPSSNPNQARRVVQTHVVEARVLCPLCDGAHALFRCPRFLEKTVAARREFIHTARLCYNCINTKNHSAHFCTSRFTCAHCDAKHHTLLHVNGNGETSARSPNPFDAAPRTSTETTSAPANTVHANVCQSPSRKGVLLPTAWGQSLQKMGEKLMCARC